MVTPLLAVEGVSFGYGQQTLLYNVSLHVQAGEMIGLLGPNGSGKTTLLRLISGVLRPQQGRILLDGRDLRQWGRRKVAQHIAVVPQELHIPFAYTVEQMVGLGRTPFVESFWGTRKREDRHITQEAMEAAGVAQFANRVFNELSGGERQRVTVAMALAQQPVVLLLDEPTSHLDIKYQIETLELVQKLNRERGVTVIAAIHDLNLASRYFPRLVLFQRGIVADASPAEVLEPGLLSRVYGIDVQVGILRGAEHLSVLPPASVEKRVEEREKSSVSYVHMMAGGGTGELLMRALADAHIPFVAGALNIGDSDYTLALRLAKDVIAEQPFTPLSDDVCAQMRASLEQTTALLLCPTAIGPGNLVLLQLALEVARKGTPIIIMNASVQTVCAPEPSIQEHADTQLDQTGITTRDYTGGKATLLVEQLLAAGAIVSSSVSEVMEEVRRLSKF